MKITKETEVLKTNDYSLFKRISGNRDIDISHVNKLEKSMKNDGYLRDPIKVNEKFEIIDGQHRFEAAKKLNHPIQFIINEGYNLKDVQIQNINNKNWSKKDYLHSFCDMGYPEYIKFREFTKKYDEFPFSSCLAMVTNQTNNYTIRDKNLIKSKSGSYNPKKFENGKLKISNIKKAEQMADNIRSLKPHFESYDKSYFILAMISVMKNNKFDFKRFYKKVKNNPNLLKKCNNVKQYKEQIQHVYNFKTRKNERVHLIEL